MSFKTRQPRTRLVVRALALALMGFGAAAVAQDEQTMQRIDVTGSRIKKAEVAEATPVNVITREQLETSGLQSIGDVLQQLSGSGSSLNTKFNSSGNFGYPPDGSGVGAGSTTVDLRHLGAKRVLVLVDGIRWVNESSASGVSPAVDLNTIPLSIVERIEVLEDGASSIYGSDAIAGVVNVITRRDLEGGLVNLYYGQWDEGDGETASGDVSYGGSTDRASFFISASRYDQKEILSRDREQSSFPVPGTGVTRGSSATPRGRFIFVDPNTNNELDLTLTNGLSGRPVYNPANPASGGFQDFTGADRFNFSQFNLLLTPSKRTGLFGQVRVELTDNTTWYLKTLYNTRESTNQAAPEPIFVGPGAGTGGLADTISIDRTNPFNPFGFTLDANSNFVFIGRRPIEGGPRIYQQDVDTWYISTGLEGSLDVGNGLFWDLNYVNSENKAEQVFYGSYNIARIARALGPVSQCTAPCVPLDLFGGPGTITPEMLSYIQYVGVDRSANNLEMISANISGDLFDLPAGALAFAAGYEHREQDGFFQPDAVTVSGESNGVPSLPTSGKYDVNEYYAELAIPVLSDTAFAKALDFSLAGRYSDYSTFGGESTGKLGMRWQVNDDFTIRGSFAEGFRAPSIGELFGSASRFDAVLNDPCSGYGSNSGVPANIVANCQALGVPANYQQPNPQISVVTGGNDELEPETADSTTLGFVYSPAWAENTGWSRRFDVELTWYKHKLKGAIQALDAQTQLDLCVGTLDDTYCNGIVRNQTGNIAGFQTRLTNLGRIDTDGVDVNFYWTLPESDMGDFTVAWRNTIVNDYEAVGAGGLVEPREVGRELNDSGIPRWSSNLQLGWTLGSVSAAWTMRYTSKLEESCSDFLDGTPNSFTSLGLCSDPNANDDSLSINRLGGTTYNDLQLSWRLPEDFLAATLTAGVNNVFDKDAPTCLTCSLNGYDASNYDLPGRFWYAKAAVKF